MMKVKTRWVQGVLVLLMGSTACNKASEPQQNREAAKPSEKAAPVAAPTAPAPSEEAPTAPTPTAPAPSAAAAPPVVAEGPAPTPVPCDGPALAKLAKQLDTAGGIGVDLGTEKGRASIDAAIAAINGKRVAFKNCAFKSQGNDEVSFAARKGAPNEITCRMAGGEQGNKAFRNAAMKLDMEKLRLDVVGVVGSNGDPHVTRYLLTECTITPHE
ncbi:MAG: hypothetical protein ACTHU0_02005 [Kofleriaceae bacterium]